mmetsp:Transcript_36849/g.79701  ORF Transcript_36849/g.79701 Transcript_36849/m.79701 type:complete len:197 (+) Transcript_36849:3-593(+)
MQFVLEKNTDLKHETEDKARVIMTGKNWKLGLARADFCPEPGFDCSWGFVVHRSTDDNLGVFHADEDPTGSEDFRQAHAYLVHHSDGGHHCQKEYADYPTLGSLIRERQVESRVGVRLRWNEDGWDMDIYVEDDAVAKHDESEPVVWEGVTYRCLGTPYTRIPPPIRPAVELFEHPASTSIFHWDPFGGELTKAAK